MKSLKKFHLNLHFSVKELSEEDEGEEKDEKKQKEEQKEEEEIKETELIDTSHCSAVESSSERSPNKIKPSSAPSKTPTKTSLLKYVSKKRID